MAAISYATYASMVLASYGEFDSVAVLEPDADVVVAEVNEEVTTMAEETTVTEFNPEHLRIIGVKWAAKRPVCKELREFGLFDRWEEVRDTLVAMGYVRGTPAPTVAVAIQVADPIVAALPAADDVTYHTVAELQAEVEAGKYPQLADVPVLVRIYTTAPVAYDGFSTRTVDADAGEDMGKTVRMIECEKRDEEWQRARYFSGLHSAYDSRSWDSLVKSGLAKGR